MDFFKHAVILTMIECLTELGRRPGKTHIIKGLFLADAAGLLKPEFLFFLYKHGPYSVDIEANLEEMQSYGAIEVEAAQDGYGVIVKPGEMAPYVRKKAVVKESVRKGLERVCKFIKSKNVSDLERLATAAWIRTREGLSEADDVAIRLHELKPHISLADAYEADQNVLELLES